MYRTSIKHGNTGWRQQQQHQKRLKGVVKGCNYNVASFKTTSQKKKRHRNLQLRSLEPMCWETNGGIVDSHWSYRLTVNRGNSLKQHSCRFTSLRDLVQTAVETCLVNLNTDHSSTDNTTDSNNTDSNTTDSNTTDSNTTDSNNIHKGSDNDVTASTDIINDRIALLSEIRDSFPPTHWIPVVGKHFDTLETASDRGVQMLDTLKKLLDTDRAQTERLIEALPRYVENQTVAEGV